MPHINLKDFKSRLSEEWFVEFDIHSKQDHDEAREAFKMIELCILCGRSRWRYFFDYLESESSGGRPGVLAKDLVGLTNNFLKTYFDVPDNLITLLSEGKQNDFLAIIQDANRQTNIIKKVS